MLVNGHLAPKILVRSPNWVGDAVMATPVPRALKRTQPHAKVHVLAKSWVAPVWERHPDVDRVIVMNPGGRRGFWNWLRLVWLLRREHYNLTLILPGSFSSAWLAFWGGCAQRFGYAGQHRGWLLTHGLVWKSGFQSLARPQVYLNIARAAGADLDVSQEWVFTLRLSNEELSWAEAELGERPGSGLRIGLAPGSVAQSRRWPSRQFAVLADRLAEAGHQVLLLGSPADRSVAEEVARQSRTRPKVWAGRTSLRQAMALIRRLDVLVSNDSGAMHLAYAQNVPAVVVQGAADFRVTGPFGPNSQVVRSEQLDCVPCVRNECPRNDQACMETISMDQVWAKVQDVIRGLDKNRKIAVKSER